MFIYLLLLFCFTLKLLIDLIFIECVESDDRVRAPTSDIGALPNLD